MVIFDVIRKMCIIVPNFCMNKFLEKSTQSLNSADILIKQQYYSSTVNRAYYGYFQFLMHILFEKLKKDKEQFYLDVQAGKEGSHVRASNLICTLLCNKISSKEYKWFQKTIKELKKNRVTADYHDSIITPDEGSQSIKWANDLIKCVEQNII
jgi:uncharacterized protein (UPF0332 family)